MTGLVCLQGGGELQPGDRPMDAQVLSAVSSGAGPVRVVVTALAGAPGSDARTAERGGVEHYRSLGADAVAAPDARTDRDGALAALATADLVVLPGGSPSRLLDALRSTGVGDWLVEAVQGGTAVSGASAGAMVLCSWTVLPDRGRRGGPAVEPGLGLVEGVAVLPHWSGDGRGDWLRALDDVAGPDVEALGLAELSGVLVAGGRLTAVGAAPARLVRAGLDLAVGASRSLPPRPAGGLTARA